MVVELLQLFTIVKVEEGAVLSIGAYWSIPITVVNTCVYIMRELCWYDLTWVVIIPLLINPLELPMNFHLHL